MKTPRRLLRIWWSHHCPRRAKVSVRDDATRTMLDLADFTGRSLILSLSLVTSWSSRRRWIVVRQLVHAEMHITSDACAPLSQREDERVVRLGPEMGRVGTQSLVHSTRTGLQFVVNSSVDSLIEIRQLHNNNCLFRVSYRC